MRLSLLGINSVFAGPGEIIIITIIIIIIIIITIITICLEAMLGKDA